MTKIYRITGLPGTGKTTYLSERLEYMFKDLGISPDNVLFSSFSRATSRAIFSKMRELDYPQELLPHFRTLHSLSSRVLGLTKADNSFVEVADYKSFCATEGIPYRPTYVKTIDDIERFGVVGEEYVVIAGNILFSWWQYLKKRYIREEAIRAAMRERTHLGTAELKTLASFPTQLIIEWYQRWESYKRTWNKYEYDDMLQEIVLNEVPFNADIDYMLIDEAQDLNPLQFELVKQWMEPCEEVYFSLDKNQCIYFFTAADPDLTDQLSPEELLLRQSYRVPRLPWEAARTIAHIIGDHTIDSVEPKDALGDVLDIDYRDVLEELPESDVKTFLLFRTHNKISDFMDLCLDEYILTRGIGRSSSPLNSPVFTSTLNLLQSLYYDDGFEVRNAARFLSRIPAKHLKRGIKQRAKDGKLEFEFKQQHLDGSTEISTFYSFFKNVDSLDKLMQVVSDPKSTIPQKEYLLELPLDRVRILDNVYVGTYFAVKGGEAERVFNFDYKPHPEANVERDEARLVFTGITRTEDIDYIVGMPNHSEGIIHSMLYGGDGGWG